MSFHSRNRRTWQLHLPLSDVSSQAEISILRTFAVTAVATAAAHTSRTELKLN